MIFAVHTQILTSLGCGLQRYFMRRTDVWLSVYWNFIIHQIFLASTQEFQSLHDLSRQTTVVPVLSVAWHNCGWWWTRTWRRWWAMTLLSWSVVEVDESDPEDEFADQPGTTIRTKFSVLQSIRIHFEWDVTHTPVLLMKYLWSPHPRDVRILECTVKIIKAEIAKSEPTSKRREDLGMHSENHFLKGRNCEICQRTKITRAPCRRRKGEAVPRAVNFGDLITADHKVLSDNCESRNNHRYAVVVQDLAISPLTHWVFFE